MKVDIRAFGNAPAVNEMGTGGAGLYVYNKRPHPNATRVFVNWMLSQEIQFGLAKATDQASRRRDVPVTTLPDATPEPGAHYIAPQREDTAASVQKTVQLINDIRKEAK